MTQLLGREFKITMMTMLRTLIKIKQVDSMQEQTDNVNREMETLRKNKNAENQKHCSRNKEWLQWTLQLTRHSQMNN